MSVRRPEVPNFGHLLGPYIEKVPAEAQAAFLAGLERSAAARYRSWVDSLPDHADVLRACAEREDRIADLVSDLFPVGAEHQEAIDAVLGDATTLYYSIFDEHPVLDQLFLQSEAELQGAMAWVGFAASTDDVEAKTVLTECADLERASSTEVRSLLELLGHRDESTA